MLHLDLIIISIFTPSNKSTMIEKIKTDPNQSIGVINDETTLGQCGLTKREYFAGLAMQGYVVYTNELTKESLAEWCVQMADALIVELNK